jgi:hypothetical protein
MAARFGGAPASIAAVCMCLDGMLAIGPAAQRRDTQVIRVAPSSTDESLSSAASWMPGWARRQRWSLPSRSRDAATWQQTGARAQAL